MSRVRKTFSDKIAQQLKSGVTNLALYGTETAQALDLQALTVGTITRKVKRDIESMRQTANYFSSYSFASNQIGLDYRIFLMAKNLKDGKWLNPRKEKEIKYDVIINPEITEISSLEEYGWEHCASFPNLRASVKRCHSIKVSYFDEELEEVEKELSGFEARVFQHELDHLKGLHILNWQVSFGEVELIPEAKDDFPNFEKALIEYRNTLARMKKDFPDLFNKKKTLKDINVIKDQNNPMYWDRSIKTADNTFSREEELLDNMHDAINEDFRRMDREMDKQKEKEESKKNPKGSA